MLMNVSTAIQTINHISINQGEGFEIPKELPQHSRQRLAIFTHD
jgi:hypothetical protein